MREFEDKDKKEISLICSICHKKNIDIKQNYSKIKKIFPEILNNNELSEIIKKCNCDVKNDKKNNNNDIIETNINESEIYTHKYCILLKIIFNFEIKCKKCNMIYNIKIDKTINKSKIKFLIIIFIITYIIHLFVYLFCMFLLFINKILKEYIILLYRHICVFFGIILLLINTILIYFSIINTIKKCKKNIYKYSIDIFDILDKNTSKNNYNINQENKLFNLIYEFYEWFYNQSMKHLLYRINHKIINNKLKFLYNDTLLEYITKNNSEFISINKIETNNSNNTIDVEEENVNDNNFVTKEMQLNRNIANVIINNNILNINSKNILRKEKEIENIKSNNNKNELNINKIESNNNKKMSNNNTIEDFVKLDHKDYINININPKVSKNININIHFSNDKGSQIDFSSSKEKTFQSNTKFNKVGKTALIPKNLTMSNIVSEANSFKRKRRQFKSFKIKENKFFLKGTGLSGDIAEDEEVDFSEFEKMGTKLSKISKGKTIYYRNFDLKNSNFRTKKSYKDVELNISNSDVVMNEDIYANQNVRNSVKNIGKHVHFAD